MKDLIKNVINKEKDRFIFMDYPGTVFYDSGSFRWLTEDCFLKYKVNPPYSLFYLKNGEAKIEVALETGLGDLVFRRLNKEGIKFIKNHKEEVSDQLRKLKGWLKKHSIRRGENLDFYCKEIRNSFDFLINVVLALQIAGGTTDKHFEDKISQFVKKYNLNLSNQEFVYLATSRRPSSYQKHEKIVFKFHKWLKKNNLLNVAYEKIIKNKEAKQLLNKCYSLGYFLYSGYGGVKLWSLEEEYNYVREKRNFKNSKEKIKVSRLPEEAESWFKISRYFSYLRDERKTFQQKIFYWQAQVLEEVAKIIKIERKDLEYLYYDEFYPDILNNKNTKRIIADRKIGFLWMWTKPSGHKFYQGKGVEKIFNRYSIYSVKGASEEIREFKGQTASQGKTKGYVKIVFNPHMVSDYKERSVLVAGMTSPDFVPLMKKSIAIITDSGGVTCHAAIISRELNVPCIIGTKIATKVLKDGDLVEVDANKGIVKILKKN